MTEFWIYNDSYDEVDGPFESLLDAVDVTLALLPSDDFVFMIGNADSIVAMVYQRSVYTRDESMGIFQQ